MNLLRWKNKKTNFLNKNLYTLNYCKRKRESEWILDIGLRLMAIDYG